MNKAYVRPFAILFVIALAFALFFTFSSTEDSDAEIIYENPEILETPTSIDDETIEGHVVGNLVKFYVADDISVKIREQSENFIFYVQNGKVLELDFKDDPDNDKTVKIVTVAGDLAFQQQKINNLSSTEFNGKYVYTGTMFEFYGKDGMSIYYKAASTRYDVKYDGSKFTYTNSLGSSRATISCDMAFDRKPIVAGSTSSSSSSVQLAPGQSLVVEGTSTTGLINGLNYGIEYTSISGSKYTYTYYTKGVDAGEIDIDEGETVQIKDGTVAITTSGTTVKASSVTGTVTVGAGAVSGSLNVTGNVTKGDLDFRGTVSSTANYGAGLSVKSGATVTFANKTELAAASTISLEGNMYVNTGQNSISNLTLTGTTSGSLYLQNEKLWNVDPDTGDVTFAINIDGYSGQIDTSAINIHSIAYGDFADVVIACDRTMVLEYDSSVYGSLVVNGILIIGENVTLTVENDALLSMSGRLSKIVNNGKIIVKAGSTAGSGLLIDGGVFINNGVMEFSAKSDSSRGTTPTFTVTNRTVQFANNGTLSISKSDNVSIYNLVSTGTMTLTGKVVGDSTIRNGGKITFNGTELHADLNTVNASTGAIAVVSSVKIIGDNEFIVSKGSIAGSSLTSATTIAGVISLKEGAPAGSVASFSIRGITFVGSNSANDLRGTLNYSLDSNTEGTIWIGIEGTNSVTESFAFPRDLVVAFATGDKLRSSTTSISVSGTMTVDKDTVIHNTYNASKLNLTVTGRVIDNTLGLQTCNYTAAMYTTDTSTIFTTFENAMTEALEADVSSIGIGNTTITKNLTIPAGLTIYGRNNTTTFNIGSNSLAPKLTIESSGRLDVANINLKNGTIFVEDAVDINEDSVSADIRTESGDSVTYQSLTAALKSAQSGDVITLNTYYVLKDSKMTIPEGVTIDATAGDGHVFAVIGSNLTVKGTLIVDDFYFIAETSDNLSITVEGTIKDQGRHDLSDKWFTPVGVSYSESTLDPRGEEVTYYVITNIKNLQSAIDSADDGKVVVEGKAKLGNVTVRGTEGQPAELRFKDDVDAGTLTLVNASVVIEPGNVINARFADSQGSIEIAGAYSGTKNTVIYSPGQNGVSISGPITDSEKGTYSVCFNGKTGMDNANFGWSNYEGNPRIYPKITFAGDTLITGYKNVIQSESGFLSESLMADVVTITGTVIVDNGSKLLLAGNTDILGSLIANERTSTSTNGSIELYGNIYLGTAKSDIYSKNAVLKAYDNNLNEHYEEALYGRHPYTPVGSTAVLSGKISVDVQQFFITVMPGSSLNSDVIEDMGSMSIMIDGKEWFTIYGYKPFSLDGLTPDIEDCIAERIYDDEGNTVAYYDRDEHVIYGSELVNLRTTDAIYMDLDYKVFTILIKTDASVKAVYIDDILTYTGSNSNQFLMPRATAGTHTVKLEPVSGYTAENAYLYTEDGKELPGKMFTFTEEDCIVVIGDHNERIYEVIYNVAGTEKIDDGTNPGPESVSEWNVTTILLLVLVVLISFIGVIIALRLNRS